MIEIVACFLYHLIVHDLVIGRISIHLNFIDMRAMITTASHTWLLCPFEKSLVVYIMRLCTLIYFHLSESCWISLI